MQLCDLLKAPKECALPLVALDEGISTWIGLRCDDEDMALWMLRAIVVENVAVRREGQVLFVPCGQSFRVEHEIKNVVTVVAKTFHYWAEHRELEQERPIKDLSGGRL